MPTRHEADQPTETLLLLWALREVGLLAAITGRAGTPAEPASETPLSPAAAERVIELLSDPDFVARVDGEYETTNRSLGSLAKRDLRSIGSLPGGLDVIDVLVGLPSTLAEHPEAASEALLVIPEERLRNRLGAELATDSALVRARVTAAIRAASAERVLLVDVAEFLDAVAVETTVAPPSSAEPSDLVFSVDLLSEMRPAEARLTAEAIAEIITSEGTTVLVEPIRDRPSTDVAAAFDARRLALGAGRCYAEATVIDWLAAAESCATVEPIPTREGVAVVGRPERAVLED